MTAGRAAAASSAAGADHMDPPTRSGVHGSTPAARAQQRLTALRFHAQFTDLPGWACADLATRTGVGVDVRGYAAWAAMTSGFAVDAGYAVASRTCWGTHLASVHPHFATAFRSRAGVLGFTPAQIRRQWGALAVLVAISGCAPDTLDPASYDHARQAWLTALRAVRAHHQVPRPVSAALHGLGATLTALGILAAPDRRKPTRPSQPVRWASLDAHAPTLVATMRAYLAQIGLSLRPGTVAIADTSLRHLATYLIEHHAGLDTIAGIGRTHIEGFKAWLAHRAGYRGRSTPAATTIGMRLGNIRTFFDRIIEWQWADAPDRNPVLLGDLPIPDRPLPRFLDDADAAALLTAARALPDLFDRVCVETLARTGMRKGEFRTLAIDAIVQIGQGHWLRTPVGKLHTDRYIPLHPTVLDLLHQWLHARGDQPPTHLMFVHQGRPVPQTRIDTAVRRAATAAGIGHVTPHQLRHTLATQAINRGMSLEAIAALLGHKSMTMTLTYAKIADRTVADEYFAVTSKIEALYTPTCLPADAEGPNMRALREEVDTRLLGNGHCTRPATLGCRYETICQTCAFFTTGIAFHDTLTAQRDDARHHHDDQRADLYDTLIANLDDTPA